MFHQRWPQTPYPKTLIVFEKHRWVFKSFPCPEKGMREWLENLDRPYRWDNQAAKWPQTQQRNSRGDVGILAIGTSGLEADECTAIDPSMGLKVRKRKETPALQHTPMHKSFQKVIYVIPWSKKGRGEWKQFRIDCLPKRNREKSHKPSI